MGERGETEEEGEEKGEGGRGRGMSEREEKGEGGRGEALSLLLRPLGLSASSPCL